MTDRHDKMQTTQFGLSEIWLYDIVKSRITTSWRSSEMHEKFQDEFLDSSKYTYFGIISWSIDIGVLLSSNTLKNREVQELINSNATFDVLIMENVNNDAISVLRYRFNCSLIAQVPFTSPIFNEYFIGNPSSIAYVPDVIAPYDSHLSFWERLQNTYRQIVTYMLLQLKQIPSQTGIKEELFPGMPDLYTDIYNVDLHFVSSNPSLNDPIPLPPNAKEIGGHHVSSPDPLPEDIEKFMNDAKDGVILFSMGSILSGDLFSAQNKEAFLRIFSKLKQKVIWSVDDKMLEESDNIMLKKWVPQKDILAHPNTILFISHGGLLGTYEAIYSGVPILGIPVVWDQVRNIEDAARKGFAIRFNFEDFTEQAFEEALHELINNTNYRMNAKKRSKIFHDRIATPLEEAVFWTEYVIRHKGAQHLRPSVMDLKWYQRYLIDVLVFITVLSILFISVVYLVIKKIMTFDSKIKKD
ncbi:UDP-glycosyltransferase UGT5-like [Diorhabda sublineata]|uniref:UDP-glycosyltransferase UGT5-like n=1 Tax=Diorhabda sublineata TaxID=1163346 RepID=UPI0024E0EF2A|nr:UDP-glycosyltransferase UGT5-like [Diorhabda sublineata]